MGQLFIEKLSRVSGQQIVLQAINKHTIIVYNQGSIVNVFWMKVCRLLLV